jgi:hypothetical protein
MMLELEQLRRENRFLRKKVEEFSANPERS